MTLMYTVDHKLWQVKHYLSLRYGYQTADRDVDPLQWYIVTGRASTNFLQLLIKAKPFMIARRLHEGGSYDEAIARVKKLIGYDDAPTV